MTEDGPSPLWRRDEMKFRRLINTSALRRAALT